MRLLVCGSRDWGESFDGWSAGLGPLEVVLQGFIELSGCRSLLGPLTVIHGAAPGADQRAHSWVEDAEHPCGCSVEPLPYPADWDKYGRAAGPLRNDMMLREGEPEHVLAFLNKRLSQSTGTKDMVQRARAAGVPVTLVRAW